LLPDFPIRPGRIPTAFRAASATTRPAFFPASDRFPAGLFPRSSFPTTTLAASPTARTDFLPASDSSPPDFVSWTVP
jgi:hypothetical protein